MLHIYIFAKSSLLVRAGPSVSLKWPFPLE